VVGILDNGLLEVLNGPGVITGVFINDPNFEVGVRISGVVFAELFEDAECLLKIALLDQNLALETD